MTATNVGRTECQSPSKYPKFYTNRDTYVRTYMYARTYVLVEDILYGQEAAKVDTPTPDI